MISHQPPRTCAARAHMSCFLRPVHFFPLFLNSLSSASQIVFDLADKFTCLRLLAQVDCPPGPQGKRAAQKCTAMWRSTRHEEVCPIYQARLRATDILASSFAAWSGSGGSTARYTCAQSGRAPPSLSARDRQQLKLMPLIAHFRVLVLRPHKRFVLITRHKSNQCTQHCNLRSQARVALRMSDDAVQACYAEPQWQCCPGGPLDRSGLT